MNRKIFKIENEIDSILGLIFLGGLSIYLILNGNIGHFLFFITFPLSLLYLCLFFLEFGICKNNFKKVHEKYSKYLDFRIERKFRDSKWANYLMIILSIIQIYTISTYKINVEYKVFSYVIWIFILIVNSLDLYFLNYYKEESLEDEIKIDYFKIKKDIQNIFRFITSVGLIIFKFISPEISNYLYLFILPLFLYSLFLIFTESKIFKETFKALNWWIFRYRNYERMEIKPSRFDIIFSWIPFFIWYLYRLYTAPKIYYKYRLIFFIFVAYSFFQEVILHYYFYKYKNLM